MTLLQNQMLNTKKNKHMWGNNPQFENRFKQSDSTISSTLTGSDTAFFTAQGGNYNNAAEFYASLDTASKNRTVSGNTSSIETGVAVDANDPNQYVEVQMKTSTGGVVWLFAFVFPLFPL